MSDIFIGGVMKHCFNLHTAGGWNWYGEGVGDLDILQRDLPPYTHYSLHISISCMATKQSQYLTLAHGRAQMEFSLEFSHLHKLQIIRNSSVAKSWWEGAILLLPGIWSFISENWKVFLFLLLI